MHPRLFLRVEGLVFAVAGVGAYVAFDGPVWLFAVLVLAPDLSMVGYLAGPRVGAATYNLAHTYALPVALFGTGLWWDAPLAMQVAAVWFVHLGADRAVGYGLKYVTGFTDTHLGRGQDVPATVLSDRRQ